MNNRRDTDTLNGWSRMECTAGIAGVSQDLLMLMAVSERNLLVDELPKINGSSLVIDGQFKISGNYAQDSHALFITFCSLRFSGWILQLRYLCVTR